MIKRLHTVAVLLMASAVSVFAQAPKLNWISVQDGKGLEMGVQAEKTADGNVVIMNEFYSAKSYLSTDYSVLNLTDGTATSQKTLYGAPDVAGANGNDNMSLYKVDTETGNLIWSVYSNKGSFSNSSCMTATPDNGVVLFLKMRHTSLGALYPETLCQFVDKDSTLTAIDWKKSPDYEFAPYCPVLVKINGEGKIEWTKRFDVKYGYWDVLGKKTKHTDCFDVGGITCDENGNLYIAGLYRTDINFGENANFKGARNAVTWNGDTQEKRGDMFIVKLNPNGESIWGTTTSGDTIPCENPKGIAVVGNKLYVSGMVKGDGKKTIVWGDNKLVPVERNSLFVTELSTETGEYAWAKLYNGANNATVEKSNIKPMGMSVYNNNIYCYGSFQADILDGKDVILTNEFKKLNSFIIKCDANDGSFKNAIRINNPQNNKSILEVEDVHEAGDKVYAVGYDLFGDSYNYIMDKNLTNLETYTVKKSSFGSTQAAAFVDDKVINVTRLKNTATVPGFEWTYTAVKTGSNNWACMYTCHTLEGISSGIDAVESTNEGTQVIYDLCGRRVAKATKGLYIINGKKVFVK